MNLNFGEQFFQFWFGQKNPNKFGFDKELTNFDFVEDQWFLFW